MYSPTGAQTASVNTTSLHQNFQTTSRGQIPPRLQSGAKEENQGWHGKHTLHVPRQQPDSSPRSVWPHRSCTSQRRGTQLPRKRQSSFSPGGHRALQVHRSRSREPRETSATTQTTGTIPSSASATARAAGGPGQTPWTKSPLLGVPAPGVTRLPQKCEKAREPASLSCEADNRRGARACRCWSWGKAARLLAKRTETPLQTPQTRSAGNGLRETRQGDVKHLSHVPSYPSPNTEGICITLPNPNVLHDITPVYSLCRKQWGPRADPREHVTLTQLTPGYSRVVGLQTSR